MRRTILLLAGMLLSAVGLGSDSPKEYDDKTETIGIEGTWRLIGEEFEGKKWEHNPKDVLTLRSGTYTSSNGVGDPWQWKYRIDTTRKPLHLDLMSLNGRDEMSRNIYQIDGDTLRIAGILLVFDGEEMRRPEGFKGDGVLVQTYKRVR